VAKAQKQKPSSRIGENPMKVNLKLFVIAVVILSNIALAGNLQAQSFWDRVQAFRNPPVRAVSPERAVIQDRSAEEREKQDVVRAEHELRRLENATIITKSFLEEMNKRDVVANQTAREKLQGETQVIEMQHAQMRERVSQDVSKEMLMAQRETVKFLEEHEKFLDDAFVDRAKIQVRDFRRQQKELIALANRCTVQHSVILSSSRDAANEKAKENNKLRTFQNVAKGLSLPNHRSQLSLEEMMAIRRYNGIDYVVGDIYDAVDRQRERLETIENQMEGHNAEMSFYNNWGTILRQYLPKLDNQIRSLEREIENAQIHQKIILETDSPEAKKILATIRAKNAAMIKEIQIGVIDALTLQVERKGIFD
jgi:hypothetical protein